MIGFYSKGSFGKTEAFLNKMSKTDEIYRALARYGQEGVNALAKATPANSGLTADSWYYEILRDKTSWSIIWGNTNVVDGRPISILLQYGHATRTGGWVEGRDYINPALQPIFDRMASEAWKAVTSA